MSLRDFLQLLRGNSDFAAWHSELLANSCYAAFYWELPALTGARLGDDAEFVLIDAPALATTKSDPMPFQSRFDEVPDEDVLVFPNLGGDALLIVPRPVFALNAYPHLAAFLRYAPAAQVQALWQRTAEAVYQNVTTEPQWLSTAGLGVAWLHIRIDTRPKYYSHVPYTHYPYRT